MVNGPTEHDPGLELEIAGLEVPAEAETREIIERTDGVTASFLKELLRRAMLESLHEDTDEQEVTAAHRAASDGSDLTPAAGRAGCRRPKRRTPPVSRGRLGSAALKQLSSRQGRRRWAERLELDVASFERRLDEIWARQPQPGAGLRVVCDRLGVAPEAAVLLDDLEQNVDGSRAVGTRAITFVEFEWPPRGCNHARDFDAFGSPVLESLHHRGTGRQAVRTEVAHDLDPGRRATAGRRVLIVQSSGALQAKRFHRQKLHLALVAMRHFARELERRGLAVDLVRAESLASGLGRHVRCHRPQRVTLMAPKSAADEYDDAVRDELDAAGIETWGEDGPRQWPATPKRLEGNRRMWMMLRNLDRIDAKEQAEISSRAGRLRRNFDA